ncbi:gluconate 2-dehydrogenase subunit 3 family protein (plasmid) [Azospirillum argentinense]|uniref:Gluconate 2-dehydrogenase subunit 3 family protein n=1 Tax=Azospirillum argentinense TaxID=2970906 RepID=A0A4D8PW32_9PROT|nr:gluconate 2-dehydrogenase subunit 3 family protein [Azospirillum argentinense]QCO00109.1 gluconate 2-dehydrogenase subunit 3 family protein [Azospirillum argentinense]
MISPVAPHWALNAHAGALTHLQLQQLDRLMDGLLPGDKARRIPSASEAGAAQFVSRLLAQSKPVYSEIPEWAALYPIALAGFDQVATTRFGTALIDLAPQHVNVMLQELRAGQLKGMPVSIDQTALFKILLRHCYQGCFGDPRWGGNRHAMMWHAIGYPLLPADR